MNNLPPASDQTYHTTMCSVKRLLLTAMTVLLLGIGTGWAGPFEDGVAASRRGDYATALRIFHSLAGEGNAEAQFNLGVMYFDGKGVPQDYAEAAKWFRLAATQGNADAQFKLGTMYAKGQGVVQSHVRAHLWFSLSSFSGNSNAVSGRQLAAKRMTAQQLEQARKLARECQQRKFKDCD